MKFLFFFGPDKLPFKLLESGMVENTSTMPFHGIISRGLLSKIMTGEMDLEIWYRYAPHLNQMNAAMDSGLLKFLSFLKKCKVLSFGQSAWVARQYLEQYYQKEGRDDDMLIEIWNIKEGHTTSVWKITEHNTTEKETFILNVARDHDASKELRDTSEKLQIISKSFPDLNMAKVFDIAFVKNESLPFEVTVTRNEWIDNSFEIHSRKNELTYSDDLVLVERFLTDDRNPSKITSVVGRIFSESETRKINEDINNFLTNATKSLGEKTSLNINEGDVVWNGKMAIVVALT